MTEKRDHDRYMPPDAPLAMRPQEIERQPDDDLSWLQLLRQFVTRRARHE